MFFINVRKDEIDMKKLLLACCITVLCVGVTGCVGVSTRNILTDNKTPNAQIPSPFVDVKVIKEAISVAGFEIYVPEKILNYKMGIIQAVKGDMIQVFYNNDKDEILVRKAIGTEDVSGDYREYEKVEKVKIGNFDVTLKSNKDKIYLATWTDGKYSFSVSSKNGIDKAQMKKVTELKQMPVK